MALVHGRLGIGIYCAVCQLSINVTPVLCIHIYVLYVTPIAEEQSNGRCTVEGNNAATVGTFFGGLVSGGVSVVLVVGIVLGLVKLRKQRKGAESVQEQKKM